MKYYYTYKVQCTAVGWEDYYYLGKHVTSNLDDGYKGSGKKLHEYYKQYPNDYTFTILAFYSNKTELNIAEQKLIGDLWKTDEYCLNMNAGGNGNWSAACEYLKGRQIPEEHKQKLSQLLKGRPSPFKGKHQTEEAKRKIAESRKDKPLSEETKRKIGLSKKGKQHPNKGKKMPKCAVNTGKHRVYREDGTYYYTK